MAVANQKANGDRGTDEATRLINAYILRLHNDLRKAHRGKWAVFIGAGATYDYGIQTMTEMAATLNEIVLENKPNSGLFSRNPEVTRSFDPKCW